MSIVLKNIEKKYGKQTALHRLNLEVPEGRVVGLLGPNGAGKTTLMKILTGIMSPTSGTASVCGYPSHSLAARKKIGYLPENNPLYPEMYVREYLSYVAGIYRADERAVSQTVERVGLRSHANQKIQQLSKGYRQRVGLAQAMLHDPEVLILDEPTTGLDPNQLVEIRNLIKALGSKKTLLLSTHIMQEVSQMCTHVAVIHQGAIVKESKIDEINLTQGEAILVRFGSGFDKTDFLQYCDAKKLRAVFSKERKAWKVETAQAEGSIQQLMVAFSYEKKLDILHMEREQNDMEHVFRTLTKT